MLHHDPTVLVTLHGMETLEEDKNTVDEYSYLTFEKVKNG